MKILVAMMTALGIGMATPAWADMFTPSHSCSKPYKPYEFNDQYEIDNFRSEVESYKRCIEDFVEEQNDAAIKHQNAAEEAIDEWNSYVNYELNF
tara:strand:- start:1869 stop:2153 length:285 start_codon:yes stop_codon:yes gene_type:complete